MHSFMEVNFKRLRPEATIPTYGRNGDAGLDLYACEDYIIEPGERCKISLGFAMELPDGYVALMWDRGGMAAKHGIHSIAGVIDSNYRGEVIAILFNTTNEPYTVTKGDKVIQMLIQRHEVVQFKEVPELTDSERGGNAWLSSGK